MTRILVLGASRLQMPALIRAREMGFETAVADYNPRAEGIPLADSFYEVSTVDEKGVYEAAKDFHADGIVTLATDMPMRALAYACERLGLAGLSYDAALRATDKALMIRAFEEHGIAHPAYAVVKRSLNADALSFNYPAVIKPVDSSGSRGVCQVNNCEELQNELDCTLSFSSVGKAIIEELMVGPEVSVEVVVIHGIPHVIQVTDKTTTGAPHFVETGHTQPSCLSESSLDAIRDLAGRAALAVGIEHGPAHAEIINTLEGPKLVEIGARLGGDCITTHLVPLSTGVDMVEAAIRCSLGETPSVEPKWSRGSAIRFLSASRGVVEGFFGADEARSMKGVSEVVINCAVGDCLSEITSSVTRPGYVIASGSSSEAAECCDAAKRIIRIKTRQEDQCR